MGWSGLLNMTQRYKLRDGFSLGTTVLESFTSVQMTSYITLTCSLI